jgi:hypothetical protein
MSQGDKKRKKQEKFLKISYSVAQNFPPKGDLLSIPPLGDQHIPGSRKRYRPGYIVITLLKPKDKENFIGSPIKT